MIGFLIGFLFGGFTGICVMAMVQINKCRYDEKDDKNE
jgi:heme/copper-type cytochrome/quinol oxidase subunit 1